MPSEFSVHTHLLRLRRLFAQKVLRQVDLDMLQDEIEDLVAVYWLRNQRVTKVKAPIRVVEALGTYFMAFDYIVCAIQLLGDYMQLPLWWEKFAESFNPHLRLPDPGPLRVRISMFYTDLSRRLVAALDIYKGGKRPPLREVVALKKMLFCSPLGRHRLKDRKWNPWREDGECFCSPLGRHRLKDRKWNPWREDGEC
ncbi:hypothetical protein EPH_0062500 [Eimeria praecox]|uniref:Uncharacterized protein n=1 Tax=Eimeria praecox TaxID=51316 RepID=U6HB40_9EIME|nr:hypothetical protein EPH_0062500 [Eimeria praecox]